VTFVSDTESYERWRAGRIPVVAADLETKHKKMAESAFVLLRGTYYRFAKQFFARERSLAQAPRMVAVGDLHIENFGTWRDRDGRLAWGVNDLDEIDLLPYTIDLARLATSALLAIREQHLSLPEEVACESILSGWLERMEGETIVPFVIAEHNHHLYRLAAEAFVPPVRFARTIAKLPPFDGTLPKSAARLVAQATPWPGFKPGLRTRIAGVGSLGSRRIVCAGELSGGLLVREAKQIPGPATAWLFPKRERPPRLASAAFDSHGVAADPFHLQRGKWVVRPLSTDATRLELATLKRRHDERTLLASMGAEAANVHLTEHELSSAAKAVATDCRRRPEGWLLKAAERMASATERDLVAWRKRTT
jgi:hypothetical protein